MYARREADDVHNVINLPEADIVIADFTVSDLQPVRQTTGGDNFYKTKAGNSGITIV